MAKEFTVPQYPNLGTLTDRDVVFYDVYSCGYNIPAKPSKDGLMALEVVGDTWNLIGMELFVGWDEVHDARRHRRVVPSSEEYQAGLEKMPSGYYRQTCNDIYHYHDVARLEDQCSSECFDLTRSELKESLEVESEEFRAWILSNPAVGDKFYGMANEIPLVQRSK